MPARITDKVPLKNRLRRQWKVSRDPALKDEDNRLQKSVILKMKDCWNDHWSMTLESLVPEDQSLWKMTKRVMKGSNSLNSLITLPTNMEVRPLKQGKGPALSWSYRSMSLLYKMGKFLKKILLDSILGEVGRRGLLRDELFGFRPKHSTSLHLARLAESD